MTQNTFYILSLATTVTLITGCHKTFFNDEPTSKNRPTKVEAPKSPSAEKPSTLIVDCVYDTSSNLKLQITINIEKKTVLTASLYDSAKNQTAEETQTKIKKQSKKGGIQSVELEDGTTLQIPNVLYANSEDTEIRANEEDLYRCL